MQIVSSWMEHHPEHEYYLFSRVGLKFDIRKLPDNWQVISDPFIIDNKSLWFALKLPGLIKKYGIEVFWSPNFILPFFKNKNTEYVVTIHDLALFRYRGIAPYRAEIQIRLFLKQNIRVSKKVLTISESTKRDIIELFGADPDKIAVTYAAGLSTDFAGGTEIEAVRTELISERPFFLFIGTIEPRKNLTTILQAYRIYRQDKDRDGSDPKKKSNDGLTPRLVLAGGRGWHCDDIYNAIASHPYSNDIIVPGFINDDEKRYLYEHAIAFLYPSLYEGFGIPVLEAYGYHLPVITARNSSLTEAGGDAAFYIETYDAEAMAYHMHKIENMNEEELTELYKRMDAQLSAFSWRKCADETLAVLTMN